MYFSSTLFSDVNIFACIILLIACVCVWFVGQLVAMLYFPLFSCWVVSSVLNARHVWAWPALFARRIAPLGLMIWTPSNTWFLGPPQFTSQRESWSFRPIFAQLMAVSLYTSQWASPFPLKVAPLRGDLDPYLIRYMVPWAYPSQLPEWHHDRFSHFCRADR